MASNTSYIPTFSLPELREITKIFTEEIKLGIQSPGSSLPCIPHPIDPLRPHAKERGMSVVIGGSAGASCEWQAAAASITLSSVTRFPIPSHITTEFLKTKLFHQGSSPQNFPIGLNLAFRLRPELRDGFLDGTLLANSKESRFDTELIGNIVGKTLEDTLKENNTETHPRIAVANDSICLLLAANMLRDPHDSHPPIAGIVGTGVNFAFFADKNAVSPEKCQPWIRQWHGKHVAINAESGHFRQLPQSVWDTQVDKESKHPGHFLAEKQISGAYLSRLYNKVADEHAIAPVQNTQEIDRVAQNPKEKGHALALAILERSAQLVAMKIAGIVSYLQPSSRSITLVMEGSVYWKGYRYQELVQYWLTQLIPSIQVKIKRLDDSNLIGGALLASSTLQEQ